MKFGNTLIGVIVAGGLMALSMSPAYATLINFDQKATGASGSVSYSSGGGFMGNDITFSFVSSPSTSGTLDCNGCLLNFETGSLSSISGNVYTFNGGGNFSLAGDVYDGGTLITSGTFLTGTFGGPQTFVKQGGSSGFFNGNGNNSVDAALSGYYGIDPNAPFLFMTTNFSAGGLSYTGDEFSGNVDAADLNTRSVPEPQELAIFGLGLVLMVGSMLYRRRRDV